MTLRPALVFRWIAFLLAAGYCIRTLFFGGWDGFGGPFRYLTIWALFCSFFAFSRMMAIEEGLYLHGLGPLLQVIDTIFVHRSYRRLTASIAWLVGLIATYVLWVELFVQQYNDSPEGSVTSGLSYPFLNNLELSERAVFYASNLAVGIVVLLIYAAITWAVRRRFPAPVMP